MLIRILRNVLLILFFFPSNNYGKPNKNQKLYTKPEFLSDSSSWVDSVFNSLSINERISQSIMMAAFQNGDSCEYQTVYETVKKYNIGGIIFFQGGPIKTVLFENRLQSLAKTPLLMTIDGEWGLAMRLDSTMNYPKQMMLGAISDNQMIYQMGCDIAAQLHRMGLHSNLSPDADINNNPQNPVIGSRSFGEDRELVFEKALVYMKALQNNHIIATAKHFPGHGDTETDSHVSLPLLPFSSDHIDSLELFPFKKLIENGLTGMMIAHLNVPAFDSTGEPSSLSKPIVTGLLKKKLGFEGLVFTDGLNMKGVANHKKPDQVAFEAYLAGNDILLMPDEIPALINKIRQAADSNVISYDEINKRCKKILLAKNWVGLNKYKPVDTTNLVIDLNNSWHDWLRRKLIESAITVVQNKNNILPLKRIDTLKLACVSIGVKDTSVFQQYLGLYAPLDFFPIDRDASDSAFEVLRQKLIYYNLIVVGVINTDMRAAKKFGITDKSVDFIKKLADSSNVVIDLFSSAYALDRFQPFINYKAIVLSYEDKDLNQELSAQLIFGGISAKGKLPVKASDEFLAKTGITWDSKIRVKYTIPEELGINSKALKPIDSLVNIAIKSRAIPGCVIYLAKEGKVFYNKSFGYFTYDSVRKVKPTDIYDLASITKIAATAPAIMMLTEQKRININDKLSKYLASLKSTNKNKIIIKDVLAHQARLNTFIPFYLQTLKCIDSTGKLISTIPLNKNSIKTGDGVFVNCNTKYTENTYSSSNTGVFNVKVAENLYIRSDWRDSIFNKIFSSEIYPTKTYHYSDIGFMLLSEAVIKISKKPLDQLLNNYLYIPLGAITLGFNPLDKFSKEIIVPTEDDKIFRKQLVQGYVHDPTAAMLGGISGHAGLFSNANDLGKLMQLYLNKGEYGGQKYFETTSFDLFTSRPFGKNANRRGLAFDKPEPDTTKQSPVSRVVSDLSYGHSGFTGTMAWVDPKYQLVYIFLSNRVYPDASINKLAESNLRTNIQEVVYKAFK